MNDQMTNPFIDYDAKVQNALRHVVRSVLKDTEEDGMVGDHHFYIAFKTQAEGVQIPAQLISRFPEEMTIVIQHKFWGLKVFEDYFEIVLSFNKKPEHLLIPFSAIVGFVDPSVQFALQFHDETEEEEGDDVATATNVQEIGPEQNIAPEPKPTKPAKAEKAAKKSRPNNGSDNIVTLDAFRKK